MRARPRAWPRARSGFPRRATSSLGYCGSFARRGRGPDSLKQYIYCVSDLEAEGPFGAELGDQGRGRAPLGEPRSGGRTSAQIAKRSVGDGYGWNVTTTTACPSWPARPPMSARVVILD